MQANDFESRLYSLEARAKLADETSNEVDRLKDIVSSQSTTMMQSVYELKEIIASQSATMMAAVKRLEEIVSGTGIHNLGQVRRVEALERQMSIIEDRIKTESHEARLQALEKTSISAHTLIRLVTWGPIATFAGWLAYQFWPTHK